MGIKSVSTVSSTLLLPSHQKVLVWFTGEPGKAGKGVLGLGIAWVGLFQEGIVGNEWLLACNKSYLQYVVKAKVTC